MSPPRRPPPPRRAPPAAPAPAPWTEVELARLEQLLDELPASLEALDVPMIDGYLCGVLLQPEPVPLADWWPPVLDVDGRAPPPGTDTAALQALVLRRHRELAAAIAGRQWFDPWVFELEASDDEPVDLDPGEDENAGDAGDGAVPGDADAVYPWVAGFVTALDRFPGLLALDPEATLEPLALVYRHLEPGDLEEADDLLAEIESLEPPADLADAVEGLVQATLLLADVARPLAPAGRATGSKRVPSRGRPLRR